MIPAPSLLGSCVALLLLTLVSAAAQKEVFAHYIVGNAASLQASDWHSTIALALSSSITGFALNIASHDASNARTLALAYEAARSFPDFHLFLSFDYLSQGPWSPSTVIQQINAFKAHPSQLRVDGKPLVSTFEGVSNMADWPGAIIPATGPLFFLPSYSLPPSTVAARTELSGAFSWAAWPTPASSTTTDKALMAALGPARPYMMPVSPYFFTNLPQWNKNFLLASSPSLWYERWQQAIALQPAFVEIISWNDFGEAHHIGPVDASGVPQGAEWYTAGLPHDGFRALLPWLVAAYKTNNFTTGAMPKIDKDRVVVAHRLTPKDACATGGTTAGSKGLGMAEGDPRTVVKDEIVVDALVAGAADVVVKVGGSVVAQKKAVGKGLAHWTVPFPAKTALGDGKVVVEVTRDGAKTAAAEGGKITTVCPPQGTNWNVYVGCS